MNHKEFLDFLKKECACPPAIRWVIRNGYDLDSAWNNCHKVTWMLWILNKINFDKKDMVELACNIAEEVVNLTGEYKELCESTLRSARRYVRGFARRRELDKKTTKLTLLHKPNNKFGNSIRCVQRAGVSAVSHRLSYYNEELCCDSIISAHLAINNTTKILETKKTTKIQTSIIRSMIDSDDVLVAIEKYQNSKKRKRK